MPTNKSDQAADVSLATVLIVEDEALIRTDMADCLRSAGINPVMEAANGSQAVGMLTAHPDIGLVVSDVRMPGMDGIELACWLRLNRPEVKVILLSGNMPDVAKLGPADKLLEKPLAPQTLLAAIVDLLKN